MPRTLPVWILVGLVAAGPGSLRGSSQTIRVFVRDAFSERAIPGASVEFVSVNGDVQTVSSDADGLAELFVSPVGFERLPGAEFALGAPYPNPARGARTVDLVIDRSGSVRVGVFDILGRQVLSGEGALPSGRQALRLDLGGEPSGTYFVRVESGDRVATRAMSHLRSSGSPSLATGKSAVGVGSAGKVLGDPWEFLVRVNAPDHLPQVLWTHAWARPEVVAWMAYEPELHSQFGLVAARTGHAQTPLVVAHLDGTVLHALPGPSGAMTVSTIDLLLSIPGRNRLTVRLNASGLPQYAYAKRVHAYFGPFEDGKVDIVFVGPIGELGYAAGVDTGPPPAGEEGVTEADSTVSGMLARSAIALARVACGSSSAVDAGFGIASPIAEVLACTDDLLATLRDGSAVDDRDWNTTSAGFMALAASVGCSHDPYDVDYDDPYAFNRWSDCARRTANWAFVSSRESARERTKFPASHEEARILVSQPPDLLSITNTIGMTFVRIPAGTFLMGTDTGERHWGPSHVITLTRDFWIGRFEVTQAEYAEVMGVWPSTGGGDAYPVSSVSWFDAILFANELSAREGLEPCYDDHTGEAIGGDIYACDGYRLPTEAEWEYAARAGTGTEYSFGNDLSLLRHFAAHETGHLPVGSRLPNDWGLFDVHGNVWEWVHDRQNWDRPYYEVSPSVDPQGPGTGFRTIRGGAANYDAYHLRSAARGGNSPDLRPFWVGFRLVRTVRE